MYACVKLRVSYIVNQALLLPPPTEQVYRHYYHYYRRRVAPQVDIRVVVGVVITVVSVIQYLGWWHSYNTAVTAALRMPRYKFYNLCLLWFSGSLKYADSTLVIMCLDPRSFLTKMVAL